MLTKIAVDERAIQAVPLSWLSRAAIIVPTFNAGRHWAGLRASLGLQGIKGSQVLIVDSSSSDNTEALARRAGYRLKRIPKESFRHGATRQMAAELIPGAEILVYLTQDAIPCGKKALERLLQAFDNPGVGAAYGRQLPRNDAGPIERHARMFSYPDKVEVRDFASREELGFKAAFFSNSFAAYRRSALDDVGGFPRNTIVSEEVTVAAKMLMGGWKVAYRGDAAAIHSHPLTVRQEFSRYFDIGVHHGREQWLLDTFGGAGGEGKAFVRSQLRYLKEVQPSLIPLAMLRNASKLFSYQLGRQERLLPHSLKELISAQPDFWRDERMGPVKQETVDGDEAEYTLQLSNGTKSF